MRQVIIIHLMHYGTITTTYEVNDRVLRILSNCTSIEAHAILREFSNITRALLFV